MKAVLTSNVTEGTLATARVLDQAVSPLLSNAQFLPWIPVRQETEASGEEKRYVEELVELPELALVEAESVPPLEPAFPPLESLLGLAGDADAPSPAPDDSAAAFSRLRRLVP